MTREEARREIDSLDFYLQNNTDDYGEESHTAMMIAIKALKQEPKIGRWIPVSERLPEDDKKQYIVQKTNGLIDILGFTKDAYKLDRYDFAEYKGKNKQLFYKYDSEYGYIEWKCEAWQPLPEPYKAESEIEKNDVDEAIANAREKAKEIREKAIDDFAENISLKISESIIWGMLVNSHKDNSFNDTSDKIVDYVINTANKIAEQLKADDTNE